MDASVTEPEANPAAIPDDSAKSAPPASSWTRLEAMLLQRMLLIGVLSILVMIGMFLTNISHLRARFYWSAMFPIFGLVSVWHALVTPGRDAAPLWRLILRQLLHWLGPIVAVWIIFLQLARGQMDADAVALMTLVILAVTCFMAGVHFDRSFYWVSAVLAFAAVISTEVEAYLWMLAVIAILAIAIAAFAATMLRRRNAGAAHTGA